MPSARSRDGSIRIVDPIYLRLFDVNANFCKVNMTTELATTDLHSR
jgi:hypothetical protein